MSLIQDAWKTAEREKARRDSQSGRSFAPVLVRLRGKPETTPHRKYVLGAGAVLIVLMIGVIAVRIRGDTPLPTVPPVTSTILSEALASDTIARTVRKIPSAQPAPPGPRPNPPATDPFPAVGAASPSTTTRPRTQGAGAPPAPVVASRTDTAAVLQSAASAPQRPAPAPRQVQSVGALRIAVEQPREPDAARLFRAAIAAHRAGDLITARALYERVLGLAPNDGDALNNLGVLLSGAREFDRALELLRRAASVAPRNAGAWNNIGTVLREQGKSTDAIAAFRHALTIEPQHQGARVGLAQQYLAINALPQAKELLQDVLATDPALPEAYYTLGQVLELQGDRVGAVAAYSSFIRFAPPRLANHADLVRRRIDALSTRP